MGKSRMMTLAYPDFIRRDLIAALPQQLSLITRSIFPVFYKKPIGSLIFRFCKTHFNGLPANSLRRRRPPLPEPSAAGLQPFPGKPIP